MSLKTMADAAAMQDRARLGALLRALDASDTALRREPCRGEFGDWIIAGKSGHIIPDGAGYLFYVTTGESPRRWSHVKGQLAFCRVTVNGDDEGCLQLDSLPTPDQADAIRDALGIRKRRKVSPDGLVQLEAARKAAISALERPPMRQNRSALAA